MSSTQEAHVIQSSKPKLSPLDLRNTDLVSRLLAATPPYLYNMSLLSNTYFFSEMLRSFVQAKNDQNNQRNTIGFTGNQNMYFGQPPRRSKKRTWGNIGRDIFPKSSSSVEIKTDKSNDKNDNNEPWMIKSMRKSEDVAVELTQEHIHGQQFAEHGERKTPKIEEQSTQYAPQPENSTNLVLPPPPPFWYPPIYSNTPYGIDPLHFFIDLRVSGHIYDRQNGNYFKDSVNNTNDTTSTVVSEKQIEKTDFQEKNVKSEEPHTDFFKQRRNTSAFSVPNASTLMKNRSSEKFQKSFDVKAMGFDKTPNPTGINYVMGNINKIYKKLNNAQQCSSKQEASISPNNQIDLDDNASVKFAETNLETTRNDEKINEKNAETEAEKEKRVKDLRALIGLELVVDYMSHKKPLPLSNQDSSYSEGEASASEIESIGSPPLEVVDIQDDA